MNFTSLHFIPTHSLRATDSQKPQTRLSVCRLYLTDLSFGSLDIASPWKRQKTPIPKFHLLLRDVTVDADVTCALLGDVTVYAEVTCSLWHDVTVDAGVTCSLLRVGGDVVAWIDVLNRNARLFWLKYSDKPQHSHGFKIAGISVSYRVVWYVSMYFTDGQATSVYSVDEAYILKTGAV
jgi:hypothetical protein